MKKITLLLITIITLSACSSDDTSSGAVNSYSDFEEVIIRFRFTKSPDLDDYPSSDSDYSKIRTSIAWLIEEIDYEAEDYLSSWEISGLLNNTIDDEVSEIPSLDVLHSFNEDKYRIVFANKIPLRNSNHEHDFSFFNSLDDVKTIDVDVTGIDYFEITGSDVGYQQYNDFANDTWFEFGESLISSTLHDVDMIEIGFNNNLTEYLDYAFGTYEIQGNKLIIYHDWEL